MMASEDNGIYCLDYHLVYKVTAHGKCHAFFDIRAFVWNKTPQWKGP